MEGLKNLGIDGWSVLIYLVNFGILLSVLTYFLYRPILDFLDKRRDEVAKRLGEAEKIKAEFEKKLQEMEAEKEKVQAKLQDEMQQMKKFIGEERAKLVKEMEQEREKMVTKTNAELAERREKLISSVEKDLLGLMKKVVLHIVTNEIPADVVENSVNKAWKQYANK